MPKFDALQASLKAAAVGGIFMLWTNITIEAFKLSWHIISTSPEKDNYGPVTSVMCTECRHLFSGDLEDEPFVCFSCSGGAI